MVVTNALLDNGSDVSLCDERLLAMLGIHGRSKCFTINSVNSSTDFKGFEVDLTVEALDQSGRLIVKHLDRP